LGDFRLPIHDIAVSYSLSLVSIKRMRRMLRAANGQFNFPRYWSALTFSAFLGVPHHHS
jgi:hypothetical protein